MNLSLGGMGLGLFDVQVVPADHPGPGSLLGQDVLARWCCEFRLGTGDLLVDMPMLESGTTIVVGDRGHIVLDVEWPDGTQARGLFDTGASLTVVDSTFAAAHPDLFAPGETVGGVDADGNTGETPLLHMAGLRLLGSAFPQSLAAAVDLQAIQRPDTAFDLILGWPVLHQGIFTIDPNRCLARHSIRGHESSGGWLPEIDHWLWEAGKA